MTERAKNTPVKKRAKPAATKSAAGAKARALTPKQQRFVDEYLVDLNATQAAIRAGYSARTARQIGEENLSKPDIAAAIAARMKDREQRTEITQDMVLQRYWQIATADPNELIQYRRECCRHCFGREHAYQWIDKGEFRRALDAAKSAKDEVPIPSDDGGYGFDPTLRPHPKCPKCHGEGRGGVYATDTRDLSEGARTLYAGVKVTKEGLEVKMHDQLAALRDVGRHLGMFKEKVEHSGPDGGPIPVKALTDTERAVRLSRLLESSPELVAVLLKRSGGNG